ncbi:MAG: anaerobic ribonucleoside-triphosphate reductase activating protein [Anaerocolumna aminovalerica]|jgi:pyruvate formate lyase activating enzyme|uniref:anaerobic ribonucleoside-triphosphate reductase activating protein n=1 Tax=Anaerocolumna aminovalerica TaxID=1527 RepID=UPI00290AE3E4|nr:anaerobic ribonucleoside-triphosphate reductase activating protein [Anaerocolumna aminovalerica]MDU6266400.1 anaerobic ribonucleoside-triphosphate reductase activating protein [Anaerocolumna aminovalerica]
MEIHGFNKTTLLDYPGHLASTIFLGGCNFRCPFCHNSSLVLNPAGQPTISEEEVFETLNKRKGVLEGVCITGGEPTLYSGLPQFIDEIKNMGLKVKLDTNGQNPKILKDLIAKGSIDYVAMDIKNSKEKYGLSIGIPNFDISKVSESISFLLSSAIDYEFRTTVVKEHHIAEDFISIGKWIEGAKAYYLQAYRDSDDILSPGLSGYSKEELISFANVVKPYVIEAGIRGIES